MDESMMVEKSTIVSAITMLIPASGRRIDGHTLITAENIAEYLPTPEDMSTALNAFRKLGFETSDAMGPSFSITATVERFEQVFRVGLEREKKGGIVANYTNGEKSYELPTGVLLEPLRSLITTVTFTPPPDFGPTDFSASS